MSPGWDLSIKLQRDVPQEEEDDDDWGLALPAVMTACCRSDWMKSVTLARRRGASVSATANTVDGRRVCVSSGPRSKRKPNTGKTCFWQTIWRPWHFKVWASSWWVPFSPTSSWRANHSWFTGNWAKNLIQILIYSWRSLGLQNLKCVKTSSRIPFVSVTVWIHKFCINQTDVKYSIVNCVSFNLFYFFLNRGQPYKGHFAGILLEMTFVWFRPHQRCLKFYSNVKQTASIARHGADIYAAQERGCALPLHENRCWSRVIFSA